MKNTTIGSWGMLAVAAIMVAAPSLVDVSAQVNDDETSFQEREFKGRGFGFGRGRFQDRDGDGEYERRGRRGPGGRGEHAENVERDVQETDDGMIITLTTDDADALEKLLERAEKMSEREGASVETLSNGVRITRTGDFERGEGMKKRGRGHGKGHGRPGGRQGGFGNENVERDVQTTDNGVIITLTTDDADALQKILERAEKMSEHEREGHSVEVLSNGVRITKTSDDADRVERFHKKAERHAQRESITRTVTKIDNGVTITMTSTDNEVVEKLQGREPKSRGPVTVTKENTANGVVITKTSDDADVVERIHQYADHIND